MPSQANCAHEFQGLHSVSPWDSPCTDSRKRMHLGGMGMRWREGSQLKLAKGVLVGAKISVMVTFQSFLS